MTKPALQRSCEAVGGQKALADLIGTTQSQVWFWLKRSKKGVPAEYCAKIEEATKGEVSKHELRPDLYPADKRPASAA